MIGTLAVVLRYHCPACGAGGRAAAADGGTVASCPQCGEAIRVPRHPHPYESAGPDVPLVPLAAAVRGAAGVRLLELALVLVVAEALLVVGAYAAWAATQGPVRLLDRDPGDIRTALQIVWVADLLFVALQTVLKVVGYRRCSGLAAAVESGGWATAAVGGAVVRAAGYAVAALPWLWYQTPEILPPAARAFAQIGQVAFLFGVLLEAAALVVWYRLFAEDGGPALARRVTNYLTTAGGMIVAASAAVSVTGIALVALVRRASQEPTVRVARGVRLNFAALPPEGWYTLLGLATLVAGFGLVLVWQYAGILRTARRVVVAPRLLD